MGALPVVVPDGTVPDRAGLLRTEIGVGGISAVETERTCRLEPGALEGEKVTSSTGLGIPGVPSLEGDEILIGYALENHVHSTTGGIPLLIGSECLRYLNAVNDRAGVLIELYRPLLGISRWEAYPR